MGKIVKPQIRNYKDQGGKAMATIKERRNRTRRPSKETDETGIGIEVGWRLLVEVIRSLSGSIKTRSIEETDDLVTPIDKAIHITTGDGKEMVMDALSADAMREMVAQVKSESDIQRYLEYKEVIWNYKLKYQEHETLLYRAENYYLQALALSKSAGVDYEGITQDRDSLEYVLRKGRGIEIGLDVIVAQYLNIGEWKVFPDEPFKNSKIIKDFNTLLKSIKGAKIKPLSNKRIEPTSKAIKRAQEIICDQLLIGDPDEIFMRLDGRA
jgi:hypothetical protein